MVELCFYLPEKEKDKKMEADSRATIKNNFRMKQFFIDQDLKQNNKKTAFGSRELKDKKKRYFRYLDSDIVFKYRE